MSFDQLWAGWRRSYIEAITDAGPDSVGDEEAVDDRAATVGAEVRSPPPGAGSLFERILTMGDEEGYVVHRGSTCSVLLNAYPYTGGHVLVLPNRAVAALADLSAAEHAELWELVRRAATAIEAAYRCDGLNIGMNIGSAAGAGVPDHLHAHVLPRWAGDTNFTTAVANVRVLPEPLRASWTKLRAHWPD